MNLSLRLYCRLIQVVPACLREHTTALLFHLSTEIFFSRFSVLSSAVIVACHFQRKMKGFFCHTHLLNNDNINLTVK